jgi:hypothetical protein
MVMTYIITSIPVCPIGLAAILVLLGLSVILGIMSISTFTTAVHYSICTA